MHMCTVDVISLFLWYLTVKQFFVLVSTPLCIHIYSFIYKMCITIHYGTVKLCIDFNLFLSLFLIFKMEHRLGIPSWIQYFSLLPALNLIHFNQPGAKPFTRRPCHCRGTPSVLHTMHAHSRRPCICAHKISKWSIITVRSVSILSLVI